MFYKPIHSLYTVEIVNLLQSLCGTCIRCS